MDKGVIDFILARRDTDRGLTMKVGKAMPPEKGEYKPYPEAFTFKKLLLHAVEWEATVCGRITTGKWDFKEFSDEGLSLAAVLELTEKITAEGSEVLKNLAPEKWEEMVDLPWGGSQPVYGLLFGVLEHEVHHRGQLYVYLRMNGIVPPQYE